MLVGLFEAGFLPPMQAWYSGLLPYEYLLPSQIIIIAVMARICADFTRRRGFFYQPRRVFAIEWLYAGYLYLAAMVARFVWFGPSIPVFFHWVLAAFVIAVGLSHRKRMRA